MPLSSLAADALSALRQNLLRSLLSILGLVIGIAALVAILALGDGMEQYARTQIGTTTSLQNISVTPLTTQDVDGVSVRREVVVIPSPADAAALAGHLAGSARVSLLQQRGVTILFDSVRTAAMLYAVDAAYSLREVTLQAGRPLSDGDGDVVVISGGLAARLGGEPASLPGRTLIIGGKAAEIVGVTTGGEDQDAQVYGPYRVFAADLDRRPPSLHLRATRAEEIARVAEATRAWLDGRYPQGSAAFSIVSDQFRAAQVRQGMALFKLIFGMITGLSVIVGGVGVMNVLLITVTERTKEIGIRKAVGARRRDILVHFLAEAMTVACAGSLIGTIAGVAGAFLLIPVIRALTRAEFHAAVTGQTVLVVGLVAIAVGLLFGTYPAVRAARLSPVEAMRRE